MPGEPSCPQILVEKLTLKGRSPEDIRVHLEFLNGNIRYYQFHLLMECNYLRLDRNQILVAITHNNFLLEIQKGQTLLNTLEFVGLTSL